MSGAERKYRPDIDGLRALAVILVVLFHLQIRQVPGGFIGVDVFFVISGYLLTAIIAQEIDGGRFSIARFYERRARRILPALVVVLIVATFAAACLLLPGELVAYAKSLLGATFSYSNIYFWSTADYFDAPAQSKPLLHTWSLAVEEQFYLVLPLLLIAISRRTPRLRNAVLVAVTVASFAWSVWASHEQPPSAFYLLSSRAWELLLGSILAVGAIPAIKARPLREAASAAGVALIVASACRLTTDTPFPGVAALGPCVGALLVLAAGRFGTSVVGEFLALRPVVFIGLISYSVYLWHWPVIVFSKMGVLPMLPQRLYDPVVIALSLGLGALSWRFVERPFRSGAFRTIPRKRLFGTAAGALATCAAAAVILIAGRGLPSRFPSAAVRVADIMNVPQETQVGRCFITTRFRFEDFRTEQCLRLDRTRKNYLLLGDSHSAALWYGLATQMPRTHILQANVSGCTPDLEQSGSAACRQMKAFIFGRFLPAHRVDAVLLSARWWTPSDFVKLRSTVTWCARHKLPVVIFGPVMEYDAPLPRLLAYSLEFHDPGLAQRHVKADLLALDRRMQQTARDEWHVRYLSLMRAQCPAGRCITYADARHTIALLGDDNHLSNAGSALMIDKLMLSGQLTNQGLHTASAAVTPAAPPPAPF